jgi:hypothetical protein
MTEVTGFLVILLSKLSDEKKLAIKNDVIKSVRTIFPSSWIPELSIIIVVTIVGMILLLWSREDIVPGQSGREVISLQKTDS